MKLLVFITIVLAAVLGDSSVKISKLKKWKGYKEGDRYFYFAGDDGKARLVDSSRQPAVTTLRNGTCCSDGYWLYTRTRSNAKPNAKQILKMHNKASVKKSYFDHRRNTMVISHGWRGDGYSKMATTLTEALLKHGNFNVIIFDWSKFSKTAYVTAKSTVPEVGRILGQFINWLSENFDLDLNKVHLIGHGLGAHVVGNAGRQLGGRAARITALDPAGPLWYSDNDRVSKTDAKYVEVIHTDAHKLGYPSPSGTSDHYPNGGGLMPGCRPWDILCHHARAWEYMASSIVNDKFWANECKNVHEALTNKCTGEKVLMGDSCLVSDQRGIFRINTKADYPFV